MIDEDKAEAALALIEDIAWSLIVSDDEEVLEADFAEASAATASNTDRGSRFGRPGPAAVIRLSVDPSEIAEVIGRQGRTAHSMRVLLNALSVRHGQRYLLEIVEQAPSAALSEAESTGQFHR